MIEPESVVCNGLVAGSTCSLHSLFESAELHQDVAAQRVSCVNLSSLCCVASTPKSAVGGAVSDALKSCVKQQISLP